MGIKRLLTVGAAILALGSGAKVSAESEVARHVDASEVLELVAGQKGKIVLLNFWATWCPPCVREFPELVEVEKAYRARGVAVISISADSPHKVEKELLPFLEKHRPEFEVYVKKDGDIMAFTRVIDPDWKGTLPSTFFYDRRGKPYVKRYSEMTRLEMEKILNALLEEPVP
jgi:thiol-disulfide isomerase/thioredoxin